MAAIGRLIVMLAADVAGYASLIGADEESTLERLEAHRHQLVYPKIEEHHGHVVRAAAGSLLVEFASPAEAVRCAVELQRGMIDRNISTALDRRITFRVGIDIRGVTANGDDLVSRAVAALPIDALATLIKPGVESYGDADNLAVRVAGLADPGGICISSAVQDAIRDQLPYTFEDIGKHHLGIRVTPVHCYAMSARSVASRPRVVAPNQRGSAMRHGTLRSAALAVSVAATVGVWAVALWAWLGPKFVAGADPGSVDRRFAKLAHAVCQQCGGSGCRSVICVAIPACEQAGAGQRHSSTVGAARPTGEQDGQEHPSTIAAANPFRHRCGRSQR
jgi:adenylate cyclase